MDVAVVGGFWRLKFCFFFPLCGGCFLWLGLWLLLVVDLVI